MMCGKLRSEHMQAKIGNLVPIHCDDGEFQAIWNGHARSENLENWTSRGWKLCEIHVSSFDEGHPPVNIPIASKQAIQGIYREVYVRGKLQKIFQVVTRASDHEEAKIHPRMPLIKNRLWWP